MASMRAMLSKGSVQKKIVRTPRFASSIESWQLHDVHDPQSPTPTKASLEPNTSVSMIQSGAGKPGPSAFSVKLRVTDRDILCALTRRSPILPSRDSAFGLPLLRIPNALELRVCNGGGGRKRVRALAPTGDNIFMFRSLDCRL